MTTHGLSLVSRVGKSRSKLLTTYCLMTDWCTRSFLRMPNKHSFVGMIVKPKKTYFIYFGRFHTCMTQYHFLSELNSFKRNRSRAQLLQYGIFFSRFGSIFLLIFSQSLFWTNNKYLVLPKKNSSLRNFQKANRRMRKKEQNVTSLIEVFTLNWICRKFKAFWNNICKVVPKQRMDDEAFKLKYFEAFPRWNK